MRQFQQPHYLTVDPHAYSESVESPGDSTDDLLDDLIHQRAKILGTKLAVFASEIQERLRVRRKNLETLLETDLSAGSHLANLEEMRLCGMRPDYQWWSLHRRTQLEVERERRQEDVECWRDVAALLREFLTAWEAYEQTKARAKFLQDASEETGTDLGRRP